MGFKMKVEGASTIELGLTCITSVEFESDSPNDSNARSTDCSASMKICGKINYTVGGEEADATLELAKWSLLESDKADCYRNLVVESISASQVVRQYTLPNAFIVEYSEEFDDETGVGTFYLNAKQKKDRTSMIKLEGGFGQ